MKMKTMNKPLNYIYNGMTLLLGISLFVFFYVFYPFHLVYHEQFQLFLFTSDYLSETVYKPGGMIEYIARFLTQFFYIPWMGALIVSLLLMWFQRIIWFIARKMGDKPTFYPLTFLPSILYWILLCDENFMIAGVVGMILVALVTALYITIQSWVVRLIYALLMLPVLYWFTGATYIVFIIWVIVWEYWSKEWKGKQQILFLVYSLALIVLLPAWSKTYLVQYPLSKMWTGADFYRFRNIFPLSIIFFWILSGCIPLLFHYLPTLSIKKSKVWLGIQWIIVVGIGFYGISNTAQWSKEEVMAYDYYARHQQWNKIISLADKKTPMSPLSVSCLNLALSKQGLMGERMFHYFQNGVEGLMPSFVIDYTIPMVAGEIYYHLGFINTAQRYAFESMEAIPDHQKSGRAVKRLAETNLINGEYTVARKYLQILQQTCFYKRWATETLDCLNDESKINAHPEWGELRLYRTKTDFLFSEEEKDMMLGILLEQNLKHRMAYEYLMAYCLLNKDLQHFYQYYSLGNDIAYARIPKSYQEALVYIWGLRTNDPVKNNPFPISDEVKRQVQLYGQIYTTNPHAEPILKKSYSNTYWYYLHYRK